MIEKFREEYRAEEGRAPGWDDIILAMRNQGVEGKTVEFKEHLLRGLVSRPQSQKPAKAHHARPESQHPAKIYRRERAATLASTQNVQEYPPAQSVFQDPTQMLINLQAVLKAREITNVPSEVVDAALSYVNRVATLPATDQDSLPPGNPL
ncbi:hypothetical protein, partial [Kibdelosporangium philippinense]